jgi:hypothetical protein
LVAVGLGRCSREGGGHGAQVELLGWLLLLVSEVAGDLRRGRDARMMDRCAHGVELGLLQLGMSLATAGGNEQSFLELTLG